ncbi:conserved hypothetical protein [Cyanobium sp. PCC 7001]|uniref:hypothetical protein n=1 Tax=Cyanobium sp. PCC 7001 TaxID=180281 RepID=UPI00018053FB|nr:hypothetical protein [Cyanobium sp. PCC 7001]EDY38268.1 conserved hypothetical protein [Cyanobium sp. PCC 7001]
MDLPSLERLPLLRDLQQCLEVWSGRRGQARLSEDPLEPLPPGRLEALRQRVGELEVPPPLVSDVGAALREAVQAWRADSQAPNVLIVLSRPVEPMAPVIEAVLADWKDGEIPCRTLLPCRRRPADPAAVPRMLTAALETAPSSAAGDGESAPLGSATSTEPLLLSLPNLDQCFLRCIDGWSGIERLRQVILERRDRFWLLGCNRWAWKFLDHVSQFSSYFPNATTLPALDGEALRQWLAPVAEDLGLEPPDAEGTPDRHRRGNDHGGDDRGTSDPERTDHWDLLADAAEGSHRIGAELWLASLRRKPPKEESGEKEVEKEGEEPGEEEEEELVAARPFLPDLPALTDEDRYLLHSLLIHGSQRRSHLAYGLGMPSHRLQPRIQWLLAEGVLQDTAGELGVRACHYPNLLRQLADNNFFTGEI